MESRSVMSSQAELAAPAEARSEPPAARSGRSRSGRAGNPRSGNPRSESRRAEARAARRAAMPPITYPAELPVSQRRDEIAQAIKENQVVIIAGETGSGKTTQIPKICLELGRGVTGQIGHTQPRRLAARTVAERIAEELGSPLGETVGYQVRFTDVSADDTLIKLMTDGILLTELARDRQLNRYDTLIIDEAHERSLNIDFILGCLRQILPERPDLKVIITSATIDPERFAAAFGGAPVVEVSGRTYPVEVRYRPIEGGEDGDQGQAILDAVDELSAEGPGDILVFLSGEREIRDTADLLAGRERLEVLPLYSRLSAAEQHRVFERRQASAHTRRVVLATNVAETSLTVPGIHYVIDPGTARISRYSHRTKVQRLPIEPISQASANQRKGRSGRTADGICIRLYSEADFESRPEYTDPEILRTNLASVILQMAAIGLGDVPKFPFIDPPDARNIADGLTLLAELNAFKDGRITGLGRRLARLPVDPRIGRMILEADRNGCVREVLVIAAALSIQDPRERPVDAQQSADDKHRRFADPDSDFTAYLNLWDYLAERQRELSSSAFRRLCRAEYLNYLRIREWQDLQGQLQRLAGDLGVAVDSSSSERAMVHLSLLAGLLSQIGMKVEPVRPTASAGPPSGRRPRAEYLGARNARFAIFPGSSLVRKTPDWIMAAELVETSRLWARTVASIEPEWVEPLARHLVKRSYSEPHWERKRGSAVALEKVTLYGVPIVTDRKVGYGRIDPAAARELFIRHALVEGDWQTNHPFFAENRRLLNEAEELEHRVRRRGLVVGEDELFAFYDARIPADVVSAQHFDTWWKQARRADPGLLTFQPGDLLSEDAAQVSTDSYPDIWTSQSAALRTLPLSYAFEPGSDTDGVTVDIPLSRLNQVNPAEFSWQVPGLRTELVTEMIRSLPKSLRRDLVPAPDVAREVVARLGPPSGDLRDAVARELRLLRGVTVPRDAWDLSKLPPHLRITVRVTEGERVLAEGKDVAELQRELRPRLRAVLSRAAAGLTRSGLTSWDFDALPTVFREGTVVAYPALTDAGTAVDVRLFETETAARSAMWAGTRRLILLGAPSPVKSIAGRLSTPAKLALSHNPHGSVAAMFADCLNCAADYLMAQAGGLAWDREGFGRLSAAVRAGLHEVTADVVARVESALRLAHAAQARLDDTRADAVQPAVADMRAQLARLIYPGFVTATGYPQLPQLTRYLRGVERRLDKLPENPARDAANMAVAQRVEQAYRQAVADLPPARRNDPDVAEVRWMLEELRVSLFAQTLGTVGSVSENRILAALERLHP
ncbi:MAG TPA: ATP-dependent RNA helicase HrpA [Streptosporangiaceae bacterium]|nr:ATP-dependent RNA helicase HrpA [Streptosporangiaceae bacterium]